MDQRGVGGFGPPQTKLVQLSKIYAQLNRAPNLLQTLTLLKNFGWTTPASKIPNINMLPKPQTYPIKVI